MKFFIHRKKGLDAKEQIGLANMHTGQSVILKKNWLITMAARALVTPSQLTSNFNHTVT